MNFDFTIAALFLAFLAPWGIAAAIFSWRWMVAFFVAVPLTYLVVSIAAQGPPLSMLVDDDLGHALIAGYFGAIGVVVLLTFPLWWQRPEKQ